MLSSKVSHGNYTLAKTYRLCTLFSLVWLICKEGLVFALPLLYLSPVQKDAMEFVRLASYSPVCQHSLCIALLSDFRFLSRVQW